MAHKDFIKLIERVLEDPAFRARVEAIEQGTADEMMEDLIAIAADEGLEFTDREVDDLFLMHVAGAEGAELSETELAMVAGGSGQMRFMGSEMSQSFNLQYLQLQNQIAHQNRQFTMISNIMRVKHQTATNAINNIR
jgi:predicted ribosomally synthesized peptide with nif11-like leader